MKRYVCLEVRTKDKVVGRKFNVKVESLSQLLLEPEPIKLSTDEYPLPFFVDIYVNDIPVGSGYVSMTVTPVYMDQSAIERVIVGPENPKEETKNK